MNIEKQFGFYAVLTNPLLGYEYCTNVCVDAGVRFVQLRMKDTSESEILRVAEAMRKITDGTCTLFIVNDSPEIATRCGADGVHIGQDDLSYSETRAIAGSDAVIGISTHSPDQTTAACSLTPDYIGIGPVFPTPTKKHPDPVIGISGLQSMLAAATVPSVAIGGIDLDNVHEVLEAGALNLCMVRQFTQSDSPEHIITKLRKIYRSYYPLVEW